MQRICQVAAWLLALAIAILSLVPPTHRPMTGTSQGLEHLAIFLVTGTAFGIGYPNKLQALTPALVAFCAAIEVAQLWVPGRHARISDFLLDAAASCLGIIMAWILLRLFDAAIRK